MIQKSRQQTRSIGILILALAAALGGPAIAVAATVSGFVTGAEDGEPLAYADIFVRGTTLGRIANAKGHYIITGIPAGTHEIVYQHVGHRSEVRTLTLAETDAIALSIELASEAAQFDAVEVEGDRTELGLHGRPLSLSTNELRRTPAVIESDLMRTVQMLPGVTSLSDFSSGLYVRGGSADQNLILLDDADVYNPNHLFGFFSTFNVDAVKTVNLQKSGYPARYGGRLSSLLDVHNRDGNRKEFAGTARASFLAASATLEGPWRGGSWMLSGRHTFIEQLANAMNLDLPYNFYDVHAKLNWDLGQNDRTSFSYYEGLDRLDWDLTGLDLFLDWGNRTASARWTHLFGARLYTEFGLTYSRFDSRAAITFRDLEFGMRNEIDDVGVKASATYAPARAHTIDFGVEAKSLKFHFEQGYEEEDDINFNYDGVYAGAYVQETWEASSLAEIQAGLRIDYYSDGEYVDLGPRLSVRRRIGEDLTAHATYGRYNQYLNLVSVEGASFADMWFPVDETLGPGEADHYIAGVEIGPFESFDLSVEAYYKPYRNVVEFSEEFTRSLVEPDAKMNELFNSGKGEAYGMDFYLRNRWKRFEGWLGYSIGWTTREIVNFNFGEEYYPKYDRRHQFVLMQERPLGEMGNWRLNFAFRYGSGQPTTLAAGRYTVQDITGREYDTVLDGEYHGYRLPAYHRLDLGIGYQAVYPDATLEPTLQIINLYNRKNVYLRLYDMTTNPAEFEDVTMLPLIPTLGIRITF